jgi:tetratricopeptide (TPR) repeat protein
MDLDDEGFVYAVNPVNYASGNAVKRLNPGGTDVLTNFKADKPIIGDLNTIDPMNASDFRDVDYRGGGIYSVIDFRKGRVFTYDHEGNLLYVFGGSGSVNGLTRKTSAIEALSDQTLLLLDQGRGELLLYEATEYGNLINEAIRMRFDGDEAAAVSLWEEVLKLDANNQLAYAGIGKAYLASGDNAKAMEYLKKGMDVQYYSAAYKRYRNEQLRDVLPVLLSCVIALAAAWIMFKRYRRMRPKPAAVQVKDTRFTRAKDKFKYSFYVLTHPADGFYDLRHEEKGSMGVVFCYLFLFIVSYIVLNQSSGLVVNQNSVRYYNGLVDLIAILALFLLVCVGNWTVTTLMNGEGRFKDIAMVVGYSLLPMVLLFIPATILSNFLAQGEEVLYWLLLGISVVYFAILLFVGIMTVHHYTALKTIATIFLTFASMFVVLFLIMLVTSLLQQVYIFLESVYIELFY